VSHTRSGAAASTSGELALMPRASLCPVGVDVSTLFARHPVSGAQLSALLRARGIWRAKVFDYDRGLLDALVAGGVREVVVGIPNVELHNLALSRSHADRLVLLMQPHRDLISFVAVGNEPLALWWGGEFESELPAALGNVEAALRARDWQARATVTMQADILVDTWPPSRARFDPEQTVLTRSVLPKLEASGAPLFVNLYPYLAWRAAEGAISLDFASSALVGRAGQGCGGRGEGEADGGECYPSLLDAMLDALR
jgi:hypothetical protein